MRILVMAAAALALAGCDMLQGGGGGPALPKVQAGAQAPSTQTPPTGTVEQVRITDENRQAVIANLTDLLNGYASAYAPPGATAPAGSADVFEALQPGTDHRFVIDLTAGTQCSVFAVCDVDCNNVDLELIDMATGGVVGSDLLADDFPVVHFLPPANGSYMVRTLLQNCTRAPCYTGTRVLSVAAAEGSAGK